MAVRPHSDSRLSQWATDQFLVNLPSVQTAICSHILIEIFLAFRDCNLHQGKKKKFFSNNFLFFFAPNYIIFFVFIVLRARVIVSYT